MRPKFIDIDPANVSTTGFGTGFTGAGPFTMTTTNSGDDLAHQASLTSAADLSAITFTLTGTDPDGRSQTEAVVGPNATTVESLKYWKTLTSISASSTLGVSTLDVGWVDEIATKMYPLDFYAAYPPTVSAEVTGTINFDIEVTMDDVYTGTSQYDLTWFNDANFTNKSTSLLDDLAAPGYRAMRVVINSYTDTAEIQLNATFPY